MTLAFPLNVATLEKHILKTSETHWVSKCVLNEPGTPGARPYPFSHPQGSLAN